MIDKIPSSQFILKHRVNSDSKEKQERSFEKDVFFKKMENLDLSKDVSENIWSSINFQA